VDLPDQAYTLDGAMRLCLELVQALEAQGATLSLLAGYSMGGRVAQEMLGEGLLPAGAGLCLIGAHPGCQTNQEREKRLEADQRLARQIEADFDATLDGWLALPMFSTLSNAQRQALTKIRLDTCKPAELSRSLRGLSTGNQPDRRPALAAAAPRIRLVAGEHDQRYVDLLSGLVPDVVTVAGASHNVVTERPEVLASILRELASRRLGGEADA
jgi:pimeloyl-ACP methyl ester carboxylesterase